MPRLAFFGFPARGHTTPSLPVVAELTRRGVEVDYYSTPAFSTLIESAGARFVAYPRGCERLQTAPVDSADHLARIVVVTEDLMTSLATALEPRPDLVFFDASALWGGLLARRLGLPSVASITTFALNRPMLQILRAPPPAAWSDASFERLNSEHGAGLRDHLDVIVPVADLKLVYTARAFQPSGKFFDQSYLFLGPAVDKRPRDGAALGTRGSRPLAYVSLGTIFNRDHALLRRISKALAARGWQVIVSLGDAAASSEDPWPDHVEAHGFVDQIGVLAQADLFVTHGGMNSVSEALSYAVPMIVIPQAVDQHMVARQAANLGTAVVIEPDAVRPDSIGAAVERIERDRAAFTAAAQRVQASFSDVSPVSDAVDQALALIHRKQGRG